MTAPIQRNIIIKSQQLLWNFLDIHKINTLINLFDITSSNNNNIIKYIEDERKLQGLDNSGVDIKSYVYGYDISNSSLLLEINKNNKPFLHLSIHLCPKSFDPKSYGPIHIYKDVYESHPSTKKMRYVLISLQQPMGKPESLKLSIVSGYSTPEIPNAHMYDPEIQKEMDVIINVLNRLFDEEDSLYIGKDVSNLVIIHNKTNTILKNINSYKTHVIRKDEGVYLFPLDPCGFKMSTFMVKIPLGFLPQMASFFITQGQQDRAH